MATEFQVSIDCADPTRLVRFWCEALHYVPEPPPAGFGSWYDYLLSIGAPEDELWAELAEDGLDHYAITLQDPEGNEFCLH